ncbi:MAG: ATP-binding protein, partial [Candidatus Omnitrophica bacterium]|nr:ATP-binding protein [Candidatus Omnitrophota bacterium]
DVEDKQIKQKIYNQYVEAYKKGVYDYIKKDYDPASQRALHRRYFSGGFKVPPGLVDTTSFLPASAVQPQGDFSRISVFFSRGGHEELNTKIRTVLEKRNYQPDYETSDGIKVYIDDRFEFNHAGRDRRTVYARSKQEVAHKLKILRLWEQFITEQEGMDLNEARRVGLGTYILNWVNTAGDSDIKLQRQNILIRTYYEIEAEGLRVDERFEEAQSVLLQIPILKKPLENITFDFIIAGPGPQKNPAEAARVVGEDGTLWFDQGWLVGFMNVVTTSRGRPDYKNWMDNPTSLQTAITNDRIKFEPEDIAHYLDNQAEHSEQALVELTSNGFDAVDAWISRFGLGFYQALGELNQALGKLNQADERVFFAGEGETGQRLGVVFRRSNEGFVQVRPMTLIELADHLGENRQTTIVRVQKKLSITQQESYRSYLRDRVEGSRRMPVKLDDEEINNLSSFSSITTEALSFYHPKSQINIRVGADGYSVSNPGEILPEIIFEGLLPPGEGRRTGLKRAMSEEQPLESDILFRMSQDSSVGGQSKLTVQVAEMGVEVISLKGMNLPKRAIIKLPANVSFNVERGKVKIDEKYKKVMIGLIEKINDMEDLKEIAAIANLLWSYWEEIFDQDGFTLQVIPFLREELNKTITQIIKTRVETEEFIALPALEFFPQMELGETSNKIYFYPELFHTSLTPMPGLEKVEDGFTSELNMSFYHVAYKNGVEHPPIVRVGNMIIIAREHYEEAKNDPLKWLQINWWMTFQVGYGEPTDELGWWNPQENQEDQTQGQDMPPSTKLVEQPPSDFEKIMEELADALPQAYSDRHVWGLWVQEQLFPSQKGRAPSSVDQIRERLKAWNEWAELTLPAMNHPFGNALWSLRLPTDGFYGQYVDEGEIHKAMMDRFFVLPDGRKIFLKTDKNEPPYLLVETGKRSNQWHRKKIKGVDLEEIEKYIEPYQKHKPSYISFTKDGRLILDYNGPESSVLPTGTTRSKSIYFLEKIPGGAEFQMITFPDGVGIDNISLASRDSLFSKLHPDGRLFLDISYDRELAIKKVFLSETKPGSGQFVRFPVGGLSTDDSLYLDFFPDGRAYFDDGSKQKYRQTQYGFSFQRIEDILPPGYSTFETLDDGRLLVSNEAELSDAAIFPSLQIETAPGSGSFIPITVRERPFYLKRDDYAFIKILNQRVNVQAEGSRGQKEKSYFYIYEEGSEEMKPVYVENEGEKIIFEGHSLSSGGGPDGRLVVTGWVFGGLEKLYRETRLGSAILQEITIPAKDQSFEGREEIDGIRYMPDGRMILISSKKIHDNESFRIVDIQKDWFIETSYDSGEFTRVPDRRECRDEYIALVNHQLHLLTVDPDLAPPGLDYLERQRVQNYTDQNREVITQELRFSDNFFRNLTLLGSLAVERIPLAPFLDTAAIKSLSDDSADKLMLLVRKKSLYHQDQLLSFVNLLISTALSNSEQFNQYIQRWAELVLMNEKLAKEFLDLIKYNPNYLIDEELDISETPKQWQGVIRFFRDAEATILPNQRPPTVEDVFNKDNPVASLSKGRVSLATLLTLQLRRQDELKFTDPQNLTLGKVSDVLSGELENPDFDTKAQEDKIPRVVQGQEDGFAVFVRELIQNARDIMRSNGIKDEEIKISVWFENDELVVRVEDVVGMNVHKIINAFDPINKHDGVEGTVGQFGQGSKSVWLDGDRLRIRTGDGTGYSYITEREAIRDSDSNLLGVDIVRFDEYEDRFKGTAIEYVKSFSGETREVKNLAAGLLLKSIYDRIGDVRDVPITLTTFNEEPIQEIVVGLSRVEESLLGGDFFVGWTLDGKSRITKDGLEVRSLADVDWEGVPLVVRKQLEQVENILMRWPEQTPLTMTRNQIAARKLDINRWNQLRLASIFSASLEAFFGRGYWLFDLPQDVLERSYASFDPQIVRDAEHFNNQEWWKINFSHYQDDERLIELFILLKPIRRSNDSNDETLSLSELEQKLQSLAEQHMDSPGSQTEGLEAISNSYPQLESKIKRAFQRKVQKISETKRVAALEKEKKDNEGKSLRETGFPLTHRLVESFLQAVREDNTPLREARFSNREDAAGFVVGFLPTTINFTEPWLEKMEFELKKIKEQKNNVTTERHAMWTFLRLLDLKPHEYRHTEEFFGGGRSSHLTHQCEGVLENSFPRGMQRTIERAIKNGWDIREAIFGEGLLGANSGKPSDYGGVDLDPEMFKVETIKGHNETINSLSYATNYHIEIDALFPIVINVAPVNNLPSFLGFLQKTDE